LSAAYEAAAILDRGISNSYVSPCASGDLKTRQEKAEDPCSAEVKEGEVDVGVAARDLVQVVNHDRRQHNLHDSGTVFARHRADPQRRRSDEHPRPAPNRG
jgi:hypothetical protein